MKRFTFLILALTFVMTACNKGNAETEFYVRGNCDMCRETIETAIEDLDGVVNVSWDVDTKMATVKFDSTKLTEMEMHDAAAGAGHETSIVDADERAYNALPKCCKKLKDM